MSFVDYVARMGEKKGAYRALVGKPEGKRPLGRHRHRWKVNIKWICKTSDEDMNWVELAHDRDR